MNINDTVIIRKAYTDSGNTEMGVVVMVDGPDILVRDDRDDTEVWYPISALKTYAKGLTHYDRLRSYWWQEATRTKRFDGNTRKLTSKQNRRLNKKYNRSVIKNHTPVRVYA